MSLTGFCQRHDLVPVARGSHDQADVCPYCGNDLVSVADRPWPTGRNRPLRVATEDQPAALAMWDAWDRYNRAVLDVARGRPREDLDDRAPSEVETVARAIHDVIEAPNEAGLADAEIDTMAALAAIAALDAVRGRSHEHDGLPGYWVCERCGQPLDEGQRCNSGLHVGPGEDANGMAVHTTDLVRSRDDTMTLAEAEELLALLVRCKASVSYGMRRQIDGAVARFGAGRAENG